MRITATKNFAIEQGDADLFTHFEHDGPMWAHQGDRETETQVFFSKPFAAAPGVHVGVAMTDCANDANLRYDVFVRDVFFDRFTIICRTWLDTRLARMRVNWIAFGEAQSEDEWDV